MPNLRLLGGAVVCFAMGLGDLAFLNLWGVPLAWPTVTEEGAAAAPLWWQPSASRAGPRRSVDQTHDIGERELGDNEVVVPEPTSLSELEQSSSETPSSDESAAEPLLVALADGGEAAPEEVGETGFAESAQDVDTAAQTGGSPATVPGASPSTTSKVRVTGGEADEEGGLSERDSYEDVAVREPDTEDGTEKAAPSDSLEPVYTPAKDVVVRFVTAEHSLSAQAVATLEGIVAVLKQQPQLYVRVEGHTDHRGTVSYNQRLSERRAQGVASFLRDNGIAGERIEQKGFGPFDPIDSADNSRAWAKNRRVEIRITKRLP